MKTENMVPETSSTHLINLARRGKIASLPRDIREDLNHRLADAQPAPVILKWLNKEPEVQEILDQDFHGKPISAQNLSEWRQGGFREWLRHQEACENVRWLNDRVEALFDVEEDRISDQLAKVFAIELLTALEQRLHEAVTVKERWEVLREGMREIRLLRRSDHSAARLAMETERWERQKLAQDEARDAAQQAEQQKKLIARVGRMVARPAHVEAFGGGGLGELMTDIMERIQSGEPLEGMKLPNAKELKAMTKKVNRPHPGPLPSAFAKGSGATALKRSEDGQEREKTEKASGSSNNGDANPANGHPSPQSPVAHPVEPAQIQPSEPPENGANQTKSNQIKPTPEQLRQNALAAEQAEKEYQTKHGHLLKGAQPKPLKPSSPSASPKVPDSTKEPPKQNG